MNEHALQTHSDLEKYPQLMDMDNDEYDTLPAVSSSKIDSTSRNARNIILAQSKLIVTPDTTRSTSKATPVQNDKRK